MGDKVKEVVGGVIGGVVSSSALASVIERRLTSIERNLGLNIRRELGSEIYNPYATGRNRYKGQLHLHTTNSDGDSPPDAVVQKYRELGFHFIVFTDHNRITSGEPYTKEGEFLAFGGVEDNGFSSDHIVGIGDLSDYPTRFGHRELSLRSQKMLEFGGIPQVAHPNWGNIDIAEIIKSVTHPLLIEVYNPVAGQGRLKEGLSFWDLTLRGGLLAWGVAVDDMHVLGTQAGKGWIVVYADKLTKSEVLSAIVRGAFYSTTGPEMDFEVEGRTIRVSSPTAVKIRAISALGLVAETSGSEMKYTMKAGDGYVRFEAKDAQGRWAWSNPFIDPLTFTRLEITQKMIREAIERGSTDGEPINATVSTTSLTQIYARTTPKFEVEIFYRLNFYIVQNPEYARLSISSVGYRVLDAVIAPGSRYLVEGEVAVVHANKYFNIFLGTTDSTRPVQLLGEVWFKRVMLPYLLPENAIEG